MFSEGFFHPKTKELDFKYQVAATHVVYDNNTLREGIQDCRKILKDNIIPMFPLFLDVDKFQNFILSDYDVITQPGFLESALNCNKIKE
jgi:hypothetical protein